MRRIMALVFALGFATVGLVPSIAVAAPADVDGSWKLVVIPPAQGEVEFVILDVKADAGKLGVKATEAFPAIKPVQSVEGTIEDGKVVAIKIAGQGTTTTFRGVLEPDGKKAYGLIRFRDSLFPGRLERTEAKELAEPQMPPFIQKLRQTQTTQNPKDRVAKVRELIDAEPDSPIKGSAYAMVVAMAEPAGLTTEEVGKVIAKWVDLARPYGPEWTGKTQGDAVATLKGKKTYAALATELAQAAEKALPADATTDQRNTLATLLASSARLAGKDAIASEAEGRVKEYGAKLDAEYREKVPPFKPGTFAGRKDGKGNRVVLMEIFTGAECPPCVAADVAFDALLKSFKPTEFIGLQHHLHIPGPDPLTNADTVARQSYYGKEIGGTPSTFFNGKSAGGGGGGMGDSEEKYREFLGEIEPALATKKLADITLTASRVGDEIKIVASAKVDGAENKAKPALRLVLVEEAVHYPGSNKLRFHHNVVRGFPGGVAGKPIEKGEATVETTVKLADLRKAQDDYLAAYPASNPPRSRAFPHPFPPMELHDLAVVGFVQDDADHAIWHAVQVEVKSVNP